MRVLLKAPPESREFYVNDLSFSPDGTELLAACGMMPTKGKGRGRILRLSPTAAAKPVELHDCGNFVRSVCHSADGDWIAWGSGTRKVHLLHRYETREYVYREHDRVPVAVAVSPNGDFLASGSADKYKGTDVGEFFVRSIDDEGEVVEVATNSVTGIAWPPDGDRILLATRSGIAVYSVRTGRLDHRHATTSQPQSLALNSAGSRLVAAVGWSIGLWEFGDESAAAEPRMLKGHRQRVNAVAFHPHDDRFASASTDGTVRFWDAATGTELTCYDWEIGPVRSIAFAPDGMTAAIGGNGVAIVDVE